jgi:FSR family fosmidomycin resistance protein-like MFS transporter
VGVVVGTLAFSASASLGWGWRWLFFALAGLTAFTLVAAFRSRFPRALPDDEEEPPGFISGVRNAVLSLRRGEVLRWLTLLQFSDLMLDVLLGYMALYFVDVVHVAPETAALAVTVWTVVGLLGDFLIIPLLERVRGLSYLRLSAVLELLIFPAFLLAPDVWMKFVLVALLGFFNAGWYAILQGRLYSSMPGRSGTVMTLTNIFGIVGGFLPLALGYVAEQYGLALMMWLLLLGPVVLLAGIPWRQAAREQPGA